MTGARPVHEGEQAIGRGSMERITNLSAPPVVGKYYLVPIVRWKVADYECDWPVFLPLHNDARFFAFADDHYHVDPRFVGGRAWSALSGWYSGIQHFAHFTDQQKALAAAQVSPVGPHRHGKWAKEAPDAVIWRRRMCRRSASQYQFHDQPAVQELGAHYAGQQCSRARTGWICPHQHWPLGSVAPDERGVITCPLHGLQIDAETGKVLEPSHG